jgi:hypothetical protein
MTIKWGESNLLRACHYSMNASRKDSYALVLLITRIQNIVHNEFTRWQSIRYNGDRGLLFTCNLSEEFIMKRKC